MNSVKIFNKVFGLIGITIMYKTSMVVTSASPMEFSLMPNGATSMRMHVNQSHNESFYVLKAWKWEFKLTKPKVVDSDQGFIVDMETKIPKQKTWSMSGAIEFDNHDIPDFFKTLKDL